MTPPSNIMPREIRFREVDSDDPVPFKLMAFGPDNEPIYLVAEKLSQFRDGEGDGQVLPKIGQWVAFPITPTDAPMERTVRAGIKQGSEVYRLGSC